MQSREHVYGGLKRFSDDETKIGLVILELGEDPDASEFPDGTLEQGIKVFEAMGMAATKALEAGNDSAIAVSQQTSSIAVELLEEQGISFPLDVIAVLAQSALEEGAQLADNLTRLKSAALAAGLKSGNQQLAEQLIKSVSNGNEVLSEVFSVESVQAMLSSAIPQSEKPNAAALLAQLDKSRQQRKAAQQAKALPPRNTKALVAAFLAARP